MANLKITLMRSSLLFIFLVLTTFVIKAQQPWRQGEMQVRVFIENQAQADFVMTNNINGETAGDFVRCYLIPDELSELQHQGIRCEVEVEDLNAKSAAMGERGVPNGYYTVEQLHAIADSLAVNFPDICQVVSMGIGTGMNELKALKISDNVHLDENEAEVLFDGGIHGDELGGPENLIRFARDLCYDYGNDANITELINNREIWIYYCVNPYGRKYMTRYNSFGVDLNRDCGYMWNGEGNSSGPFSQPETKAYRKLLMDNQFVIHCSYHSGTEYISFPWSYRSAPTRDAQHHLQLAQLYAQTSGYTNLPYGQGYNGMYAINGSTKDFGYGATGSISWSVELSLSKQPPAAQIVPIYLKNKPSMLKMVEMAGYGIQGVVRDSITSKPIPALIFVDDFMCINNDPVVGDFHKFLPAGNYTLRIVAAGHQTRIFENVVVVDNQATTLDVALPEEAGRFAWRIISTYIPGNNPQDEGNTMGALGPPDEVRYSLGKNGYAIIDLCDTITQGDGPEVEVFENDNTPEGYMVMAGTTPDGPWILMGHGTGNEVFELEPTGLPQARYLKIKDSGVGQSQVPDAGFDLDAIGYTIRPPAIDSTATIEGYTYIDWVYLIEKAPGAEIRFGDQVVYSDDSAYYRIVADTGWVNLEVHWNMFGYLYYPVYLLPGQQLNLDLIMDWMESATWRTWHTELLLYPNPANGSVILKTGENEIPVSITICNVQGAVLDRIMHPKANAAGEIKLEVAHLRPGLYLVVSMDETGQTSIGRLVIAGN